MKGRRRKGSSSSEAGERGERRRPRKERLLVSLLLLIIVSLLIAYLAYKQWEDDIQISGVQFTNSTGALKLQFEVENNQKQDFNGTFSYLIRDPRSNEIYAMGNGVLSIPSNDHISIESIPSAAQPEKWRVYSNGTGEKPIVEIFIKDDSGNQVQEIKEQVILNG
jgi:hypothetical protein